jgi:hypothetical protein
MDGGCVSRISRSLRLEGNWERTLSVMRAFRPSGGDFQGMGFTDPMGFGKTAKDDVRARLRRLDEPASLSLGMVPSPQSPPPDRVTVGPKLMRRFAGQAARAPSSENRDGGSGRLAVQMAFHCH